MLLSMQMIVAYSLLKPLTPSPFSIIWSLACCTKSLFAHALNTSLVCRFPCSCLPFRLFVYLLILHPPCQVEKGIEGVRFDRL